MAEYISADELKDILGGMAGTTFADDAIEIAVVAASDACDGYKRTSFGALPGERYFTARYGATALTIDDLSELTSVTLDEDGDGVYETTWTVDDDFFLAPVNADQKGQPWNELRIPRGSSAYFPRYDRAVKVDGTWGWPAVPELVRQATIVIANTLLSATQGAPMGVIVEAAGDVVATARLGRINPVAQGLLDQIPGRQHDGLKSIRLG